MRYLYTKDGTVFAECEECKKVFKFKEVDLAEVAEGVECFCGNVSNRIDGMPKKQAAPVAQKTVYMERPATPGPHCPTCGSRNVQKISLTSKAVGGYMFGIFSSNIRNTFKCNACGYKW